MEAKKNPKADMEKKRSLFLQIGLVVALGVVLLAFEYSSSVNAAKIIDGERVLDDELIELIPIVREKEKLPTPPKMNLDDIIIVENEKDLDEEWDIEDEVIDDKTAIDIPDDLVGNNEKTDDTPIPFAILENKPEFPGGERGLLKFLNSKVNYPVIAQENGIQGVVYVSFVIDQKGKVIDVRLLRGVDPSLDKEALRVVGSMPDWKPGKQRGRPVKVSYQVPMRFQLN